MLILLVAFDASAYVCYITRYLLLNNDGPETLKLYIFEIYLDP